MIAVCFDLKSVVQCLMVASSLVTLVGCFTEQSFPMRSDEFARVRHEKMTEAPSNRRWLERTHGALRHLLPKGKPRALLTDDLVDRQGRPVDVFAHFRRDPRRLQSLLFNLHGLQHTAQCVGREFDADHPPPLWPGFQEVRIPVSGDIQTSGWLGLAREGGQIKEADCIVLVSGLFGHNDIRRTEALAAALLTAGLHVLAYENRGYGMSDVENPDVYYNFGALEVPDLLVVSDWLEALPYVRRTGLIGFCWSANQAILLAWYENRAENDASISTKLEAHLPALADRRRFTAGIMAFSPTLASEKIIDDLETPHGYLVEPMQAFLQETIKDRMTKKRHPEVSGSLRKLIEFEFARSELNYPGAVEDALRFVRLVTHKGKTAGNKLARARVPLLIVYAANDPLSPAQEVADYLAGIDNPNVAALMLPGGGHVGFAAYARSYYFSLILNFFDTVHGAAAMTAPPAADHVPVAQRADSNAR